MELIPYCSELAGDLAEFYNSMTADVPHCYPSSGEDWKALFLPLTEPGKSSPLRFHRRLKDQSVLVAREHRQVIGFIHCAIKKPRKTDRSDEGVIPFLAYQRGRREVGEGLLGQAMSFFRERHVDVVSAFTGSHRYPFYHVDNATLSSRLEHVHALLACHGYQRTEAQICLDWVDFDPVLLPRQESFGEIDLQWKEKGERGRPNLTIEAKRDGEFLGMCGCLSFRHFGSLSPEENWLFVKWIEVAAPMRGRGLGAYLLHRCLSELYEVGFRHAALICADDNARALLFYANHGFRATDWMYRYERRPDGGFDR